MYTKQTAFDAVFRFYENGGRMGLVVNGSNDAGIQTAECVYFAKDGGCCAGGALLLACGISRQDLLGEDGGESYDLNQETDMIDIINHFGERLTSQLAPEVYKEDRPANATCSMLRTFITRLQGTHDDAGYRYPNDIPYLLDKLEEFAKDEGLTCHRN